MMSRPGTGISDPLCATQFSVWPCAAGSLSYQAKLGSMTSIDDLIDALWMSRIRNIEHNAVARAGTGGEANGTLITSMRNSAVLVSSGLRTHPASSFGERTPPVPGTYTYTFALSFGSVTSVCVCEPRHVWTAAICFGASRSSRAFAIFADFA